MCSYSMFFVIDVIFCTRYGDDIVDQEEEDEHDCKAGPEYYVEAVGYE